MNVRARPGAMAALSLAAGLALAACGGGQKTFESDDLPGIVLEQDEVPEGATLVALRDGSVAVAGLWGTNPDASRIGRELLAGGFVDAARTHFETQTLTGSDGVIVFSVAILFEDTDSASRGLQLAAEGYLEDGQSAPREVSAEGLGEDGLGVEGLFTPENPDLTGSAFVWRTGNLVLLAYGAGALDEGAVRELAERMDERAS